MDAQPFIDDPINPNDKKRTAPCGPNPALSTCALASK